MLPYFSEGSCVCLIIFRILCGFFIFYLYRTFINRTSSIPWAMYVYDNCDRSMNMNGSSCWSKLCVVTKKMPITDTRGAIRIDWNIHYMARYAIAIATWRHIDAGKWSVHTRACIGHLLHYQIYQRDPSSYRALLLLHRSFHLSTIW